MKHRCMIQNLETMYVCLFVCLFVFSPNVDLLNFAKGLLPSKFFKLLSLPFRLLVNSLPLNLILI